LQPHPHPLSRKAGRGEKEKRRRAEFHPGGMAAVSRWLRPQADTTGFRRSPEYLTTPAGSQRCDPFRVETNVLEPVCRWYRPSASTTG
jgi:hypothetical protein